mmetsp:Transcript_84701/g.236525  ORF Transcript_84701/g.236525 Transcript_84701/m.236525 type:complete len:168 (-) Transcript_84701:240-743(-)
MPGGRAPLGRGAPSAVSLLHEPAGAPALRDSVAKLQAQLQKVQGSLPPTEGSVSIAAPAAPIPPSQLADLYQPPLWPPPGMKLCGALIIPANSTCCNGIAGGPFATCCAGAIVCDRGAECCGSICCAPEAVCCNGVCGGPNANCTGKVVMAPVIRPTQSPRAKSSHK